MSEPIYSVEHDDSDSYTTVRLYRDGQLIANFTGNGSLRYHSSESQEALFQEALQIATAATENARLRAEAHLDKWRLALESLTAQGSEFHNDLDRCVAYVRERYEEGHKAKGDRVKLQREVTRLTEALKKLLMLQDIAGPYETMTDFEVATNLFKEARAALKENKNE
jgi:GAF domain-containing protein